MEAHKTSEDFKTQKIVNAFDNIKGPEMRTKVPVYQFGLYFSTPTKHAIG